MSLKVKKKLKITLRGRGFELEVRGRHVEKPTRAAARQTGGHLGPRGQAKGTGGTGGA